MPAMNDVEEDLRYMERGRWWIKAAAKESGPR